MSIDAFSAENLLLILDSIDNGEDIEYIQSIVYAGNLTYQNAADSDHWTPLMTACFNNNTEQVEYQLELHADPNAINFNHKSSCLQIAADKGYKDVVRLLLKFHADATYVRPMDGWSAIRFACRNNDTESMKFILESLGSQAYIEVNRMDYEGMQTPLMIASTSSYLDMMKLLLQYKANVNITSHSGGYTALMLAVEAAGAYENTFAMKILLETQSVDVTRYNIHGQTAFGIALDYENIDAVQMLLEYGVDPLSQCPMSNKLTLASVFYLKNADMVIKRVLSLLSTDIFVSYDGNGLSLLHYALQEGRFQEFHYMLTKSNLLITDVTTARGITLFEEQEELYNFSQLEFLLSFEPALIYVSSKKNNLLIPYLSLPGDDRCVKLLQEYKADPNMYAVVADVPLEVATKPSHVKLLLEYKANANPLPHFPAYSILSNKIKQSVKDASIISLIEARANLNAPLLNSSTETPLMKACQEEDILTVHQLLVYNADPNVLHPITHESAFMMAAKEGKLKIFEYLLMLLTQPCQSTTLNTQIIQKCLSGYPYGKCLPPLTHDMIKNIDLNHVCPYNGKTVLHYAAGCVDLIDVQLQFPGIRTDLHAYKPPYATFINDTEEPNMMVSLIHNLVKQHYGLHLVEELSKPIDLTTNCNLLHRLVQQSDDIPNGSEIIDAICSMDEEKLYMLTRPAFTSWFNRKRSSGKAIDENILYLYFFENGLMT